MANKIEILINAKDNFSKVFGKFGAALPSVGTAVAAVGAAATASAAGAIAMAKSTASAYDSVGKFAGRIGVSTEALSAYHHVAELSGITQQTLNMGFQRMTRRISEASQGTGVAVKALRELGISVDSISGKSPDQQFEMIAGAMEGVGNQSDKARLAMQFFDSEGVALLQTMGDGVSGLNAMKEEAEKFGLVVSGKAAANAAGFNDMLTRVTGSMRGLKNHMAEEVMPVLTGLGNRFANFVANNRAGIISFAEKGISALGGFVEFTAYGVAGMVDAWRGLKMTWEVLKIAFAELNNVITTGIVFVAEKVRGLLETLNFRGIFDGAIESISGFEEAQGQVIDNMQSMADAAWGNINSIANEGMAVGKVKEFADAIKTSIAEIKEEGSFGDLIGVSDAQRDKSVENLAVMTEAQQSAYEQLLEAHDEYYLSEEERLLEWYETQQEMYGEHQEALAVLDEVYAARVDEFEKKRDAKKEKERAKNQKAKEKREKDEAARKIQLHQRTEDALYQIQQVIGKKGFEAMKKIRIAAAIITGYEAAINAWNSGMQMGGPYAPIFAALYAAASVAFTVAKINAIKSQQYSAAHGGLDYVPNEQTFLLQKGERVLSPKQNTDLTEALQEGRVGGGGAIEVHEIHIHLNMESAEGLKEMDQDDWEEIAQDKMLPAFRTLAARGQTI